ncbi:MAG: hypothetical protein ACR2KG_01725 [Nocardioidaceae bacterium]
MKFLIVLIVLAVVIAVVWYRKQQQRQREVEDNRVHDVEVGRKAVDEDVTRFGEELQRLDVAGHGLDEAARQDYQRALDCYDQAKESLSAVRVADEIRNVTQVLEDGRYAIACVKARLSGSPLPQRRAPCFFNPAHGPSARDMPWAPPGGQQREIPVCPADAERLEQGAEPDIRTVMNGPRRVPYWQGGPAYGPYAQGYFGSYAMGGLLPGLLIGSALSGGWGGDFGFDGGWDGNGGDGGYDGADGGGYDGSDAGGSDGGYDGGAGFDGASGGFDGGGFDGGGFDF